MFTKSFLFEAFLSGEKFSGIGIIALKIVFSNNFLWFIMINVGHVFGRRITAVLVYFWLDIDIDELRLKKEQESYQIEN